MEPLFGSRYTFSKMYFTDITFLCFILFLGREDPRQRAVSEEEEGFAPTLGHTPREDDVGLLFRGPPTTLRPYSVLSPTRPGGPPVWDAESSHRTPSTVFPVSGECSVHSPPCRVGTVHAHLPVFSSLVVRSRPGSFTSRCVPCYMAGDFSRSFVPSRVLQV